MAYGNVSGARVLFSTSQQLFRSFSDFKKKLFSRLTTFIISQINTIPHTKERSGDVNRKDTKNTGKLPKYCP